MKGVRRSIGEDGNLGLRQRFFLRHYGGANMFKSLDIRDHMEVVGSDDKHVGTVDHMEGADRILLTKDDPAAGGKHHLISMDWVHYVDNKVHLTKSCQQAMKEWQTAA